MLSWIGPRGVTPPEASAQVDGAAVTQGLAAVPTFCDAIVSHLNDVVGQTEDAARSIVHEMADVNDLAGRSAGVVNELARTMGSTKASLADINDSGTGLVLTLIRYVIRRDRHVRSLIEEVRGLVRHVSAIEEVSHATTMLALNARIEAARAGAAGQGFAVVAGEVRRLAERSATAASSVGTSIQELTDRLDLVLEEDDVDDDVADLDLETLKSEESSVVRRLLAVIEAHQQVSAMTTDILRTTEATVGDVERTSDTLTRRATASIGEIQFQDMVRQTIEHVIVAVDEVRRQAEDVASYARGDLPATTLAAGVRSVEDLGGGHLMRGPHHSRAEAAQDVANDGLPAIELF